MVNTIDEAKPFVKWAGGKRGILNELTNNLPQSYKTYYEIFVGGGCFVLEIATRQSCFK